MAYVSYGLNKGTDQSPDVIFESAGTDDGGGANNVTICINNAVGLTKEDVVLILEAFQRLFEDGRINTMAGL